ncbi:hypothetical protein Btru_057614 [Bulinus truncatus]|nr:hypothetical protein Btru_057614 [Bulinus truncatus]
MLKMVHHTAIVFFALLTLASGISESYLSARQAFIDEEMVMRVGANLVFNDKEQLVNRFLMQLKNDTIQKSIWTTTPYPPAISFFKSKAWIDNSTIYDVIKMMPKGGVLHVHSTAMVSIEWVIRTFTYLPDLYTRVEVGGVFPVRQFQFSKTHPGADWAPLAELRAAASDPDEFDEKLVYEMSIWSENPFQSYPTVNDVWLKLRGYFSSLKGLVQTMEQIRMYVEQALKEFYDDGVQYIEMKTSSTDESYMELVQIEVDKFKAEYPDFIGLKVILGGRRSATSQAVMVNRTLELMKKYPDLVKGFDLISQEDNNRWAVQFAGDLLKNDQSRLPYFFHAGETDWTQWVDYNLVDSVLMNASRIGHGYAVYHHPKVMQAVLAKGIAVELNPISNQVLGLVNDLRNHPGAYLIANGAPVVISSDDPSAWLSSPLSHDFYMAFMALGAVHDDLRLLKQLAMNSITYSTMTEEEKCGARTKWRERWEEFVDDVIHQHSLPQHSLPHHSLPQHSLPHHSLPQHSLPQHSIPQPSLPQHSLPQHSLPQHSLPQHSLTQHSLLQLSLPHHSLPHHSLPQHSLPQHSLLQLSLPQHSLPQHSLPQHSLPQHSFPQHSLPQAEMTVVNSRID